jgi:Lectin C-type domain
MVTRKRRWALVTTFALGAAEGFCAAASLGGCNAIAGLREGIPDRCGDRVEGCGGAGSAGAMDAGEGGTGSAAAGSSMTTPSGGGAGAEARGVCGNGIIEPGEECDDPSGLPYAGCTACVVTCDAMGAFKDPVSYHCYRINGLKLDFLLARLTCEMWGMDLSAITSDAELEVVSPFIEGDTWTGANDLDREGDYVWANSEPWGFTRWKPGEPSGDVDNHDCVKLTGTPVVFDDDDCLQKRLFLCERSPVGMPANP